ncbi:uncharacterized protein BCR38DRAFT_208664 [Pseudomassariella vexata]|uniref:Uncharacterized protein n=1 Tax=Pseudomassariella vexata TaxID=1141098 RepID=A0A1Y2DY09_9PEZI|nr:uncharacterized protein BCR38DRAFT_208664 [Pseudomassariella vexata]ORY64161.1 hypothetical protein BCR38DRAFT_208664 [Pseudomassariella vexata]
MLRAASSCPRNTELGSVADCVMVDAHEFRVNWTIRSAGYPTAYRNRTRSQPVLLGCQGMFTSSRQMPTIHLSNPFMLHNVPNWQKMKLEYTLTSRTIKSDRTDLQVYTTPHRLAVFLLVIKLRVDSLFSCPILTKENKVSLYPRIMANSVPCRKRTGYHSNRLGVHVGN